MTLKMAVVPMGVYEGMTRVDPNTSCDSNPEDMTGVPVLTGARETGTEKRGRFSPMVEEKGQSGM